MSKLLNVGQFIHIGLWMKNWFLIPFNKPYFCHMQQEDKLKLVISHAKEYGFVFPSSEIYDGLSAAYDYGQLGVELKTNIKNYWWTAMTRMH